MTLSDKRNKRCDAHYPEIDVERFIKNLMILDIQNMTNDGFKGFIRKSVGDALLVKDEEVKE